LSELEEIRKALELNQDQMAQELNAGGQSTYQRWEKEPNTRAGKTALVKAQLLFERKTGRKWISGGLPTAVAAGVGVSRDEFLKWTGRIESLEQQLRALSPGLDAVKDLDQRVQKLERRKASRG
jgi:DNA-binding XRE family transcriptional regulator